MHAQCSSRSSSPSRSCGWRARDGGYFPQQWGWPGRAPAPRRRRRGLRARRARPGASRVDRCRRARRPTALGSPLSILWSPSTAQPCSSFSARSSTWSRPRGAAAQLAAVVRRPRHCTARRDRRRITRTPSQRGSSPTGSAATPRRGYQLASSLGYWNGLGILAAMGILLAVGIAAHALSLRARRGALSLLVRAHALLHLQPRRAARARVGGARWPSSTLAGPGSCATGARGGGRAGRRDRARLPPGGAHARGRDARRPLPGKGIALRSTCSRSRRCPWRPCLR